MANSNTPHTEKVWFITGASTGFGRLLAEEVLKAGGKVVATARKLDKVSDLEQKYPKTAKALALDVTDAEQVDSAVAQAFAQFGRVDVLVNNAGNDARHSVESVTPETWDEVVAINLKQQFFMAQAVAPSMRQARRGSIINMGSIAWVIPSKNVPVYVTAKSAIVGMTRALAHEFGEDEVRVNCVMPGAILTERQKQLWLSEDYVRQVLAHQSLKRMILPEEVARLVLFLAADDSSAITNQSYVVDGGWV
jgi:D-xylose 1-dehydrogenase